MKFNRIAITGMAVAGGLLLSAIGTSAYAGIVNTKHNLSSVTNAGQARSFNGTDEVCVFCHTPHGADIGASVPLWNRALEANPAGTYTTYDDLGTTTLDGAVADVGSVSIACLSCHDGTQAMDQVINQPGSGGFNAAGARMGVDTDWSDGNSTPQGIALLGTDLRDDHPVGIQYGGGGITTTNSAAATDDPDFVTPDFDATKGIWWVDTEATPVTGNDVRDKTDMILYSRPVTDFGGTGLDDEPSVECASCHDPHVENPTFLRIVNTESGVCLACHVK